MGAPGLQRVEWRGLRLGDCVVLLGVAPDQGVRLPSYSRLSECLTVDPAVLICLELVAMRRLLPASETHATAASGSSSGEPPAKRKHHVPSACLPCRKRKTKVSLLSRAWPVHRDNLACARIGSAPERDHDARPASCAKPTVSTKRPSRNPQPRLPNASIRNCKAPRQPTREFTTR